MVFEEHRLACPDRVGILLAIAGLDTDAAARVSADEPKAQRPHRPEACLGSRSDHALGEPKP